MFCQKCGLPDTGSVVCPNCGCKNFGPERPEVVEEISQPLQAPQVTSNSDSSGCGTILAIIVFIVAAVVFFAGL